MTKLYLFVYIPETDGDIVMLRLTKAEIIEKVKHITRYDYAIIEGTVHKTFGSQLDLSKLKEEGEE